MIPYPENEQAKSAAINELMEKWGAKIGPERFESDGFYPHYFSQHPRVLFIGREGYYMKGRNYIEVFHRVYSNSHFDEGADVSTDAFHRKILRFAYCFKHNFPEWKDVPYPRDMKEKFTPDGISFAFMNLSKISGDEYRTTNWNEVRESIDLSGDFNKQEIALLEPDIIVTMNFMDIDWARKSLFDACELVDNCDRDISVYRAEVNGRKVWVFDTWHFSAHYKREYEEFYVPLRHAYHKYVTGDLYWDGKNATHATQHEVPDKYAFISEIAEKLAQQNKTMPAAELAAMLNQKGFKTMQGEPYVVGGRGIYCVISYAYFFFERIHEDEKAAHIANAFTKADGKLAWE